MALDTADTIYRAQLAGRLGPAAHGLPAAELAVRGWPPADPATGGPRPFTMPQGVAVDDPLIVRVDHGRWVVDCPDCASAQLAARTDPRFFCVECLNVGVGGLWRQVQWPPDSEVDAVEGLLAERPDRRTRSWLGRGREPLEHLRAENHAHGLPGVG